MTLSEALSIRIDELLSEYEITPYRLSQLSRSIAGYYKRYTPTKKQLGQIKYTVRNCRRFGIGVE